MVKQKGIRHRDHSTAIHEAGHAVASLSLHRRFHRVTIVPAADSLGHVAPTWLKYGDYEFDDSPRGVDRAEKEIIICYAGPLASRKLAPRSKWRCTGSADFARASQFLTYLSREDSQYNILYDKLLWREAELLVEFHWEDINSVADALLEHRTLDHAGVYAAIERAQGREPVEIEPMSAADLAKLRVAGMGA